MQRPVSAPAQTVQPPVRLGHFGLNCFDIERMEAFYKHAFGFQVTDRGYVLPLDLHLVFLTLDPREHHQLVLGSGRTEGSVQTGAFIGGGLGSAINQISFQLRDLRELRRVRAAFAQAGIANGSPINHGNAWAIYIRDVEGNPIELYVDTPWYTPQPFGEPLDLDNSDEEIHAQTQVLCRAREGFELAGDWQQRIARQLLTQAVQQRGD